MSDYKTNGSGRAPCKPLTGNSWMFSNKKKPRLYYEKDSEWREAIWTLISPNSNKLYVTQDSTMTIHWYSINSQMDYQPSSHGPAMAYISHGPADAEILSSVMDSRRRPTSEILAIFMGEPTSAEAEENV